jgi:hypothetical protein
MRHIKVPGAGREQGADEAMASGLDTLLVVDIGNTNIVCGLFVARELIRTARFHSSVNRTADEYYSLLIPFITETGDINSPMWPSPAWCLSLPACGNTSSSVTLSYRQKSSRPQSFGIAIQGG